MPNFDSPRIVLLDEPTPVQEMASLRDALGGGPRLLAWYGEGKLKPHVSMRFPLEKGAEAMNALLSRKATGKVVLTM